MPVTVAVMKSTFLVFSALRNSVSSACASNQPSPVRPERAGDDALVGQPGKPALQRRRILEHDVGAFGHLHRVVCLEDRQAVLAGKDQIAVLAKADIGVLAEFLLQPPEQAERELRQPDVFGDRELLADRGAGQRRRRMGELRIALDQRDRAGKPFLAQIIGDRAADDRAADDDDVVPRHVVLSPMLRIGAETTSFTARRRKGLRGPARAGMKATCRQPTYRPRRSVLYVPASNERALAKIAVARLRRGDPRSRGRGRAGRKVAAREKLRRFRRSARRRRAGNRHPHQSARQRMGRRRSAGWPAPASPTRILLPKVDTPRDILEAGDVLDDNDAPKSDRALGDDRDAEGAPQHRRHRRARPRPGLAARLFRRRNQRPRQGDRHLRDAGPALSHALLVQIVVAARAGGLDALDGVVNDFSDAEALRARMRRGAPPWASTARR